MKRNVVLGLYNKATYLDQTQQLCSNCVLLCAAVASFVHAIYHMSKHFGTCAGACACNHMPLLKGPGITYMKITL